MRGYLVLLAAGALVSTPLALMFAVHGAERVQAPPPRPAAPKVVTVELWQGVGSSPRATNVARQMIGFVDIVEGTPLVQDADGRVYAPSENAPRFMNHRYDQVRVPVVSPRLPE